MNHAPPVAELGRLSEQHIFDTCRISLSYLFYLPEPHDLHHTRPIAEQPYKPHLRPLTLSSERNKPPFYLNRRHFAGKIHDAVNARAVDVVRRKMTYKIGGGGYAEFGFQQLRLPRTDTFYIFYIKPAQSVHIIRNVAPSYKA